MFFHLPGPAAFIPAEGLETAISPNVFKAGFGQGEQHPLRSLLKPELDESPGLLRIVGGVTFLLQ